MDHGTVGIRQADIELRGVMRGGELHDARLGRRCLLRVKTAVPPRRRGQVDIRGTVPALDLGPDKRAVDIEYAVCRAFRSILERIAVLARLERVQVETRHPELIVIEQNAARARVAIDG